MQAATSDEKPLSLDQLLAKASDLQMMPQVARKVIQLVADPNSNATQLSGIIEKDPNITARILKISNSAFYGLRRECKTVQHAIVILGFKSLRSMVVASSAKSLHKKFGITEQLMWDHAIGTAISAKLLSEGRSNVVGEVAFVGGLLHNVGKTVMNNECPKTFTQVMKRVYNDGISYLEAENEIFGYGDPEVGSKVVEKWGLPGELVSVIRFHHLSLCSPVERAKIYSSQDLKLGLSCVEVATHLCEKLGIGFREKNPNVKLLDLEGSKNLQLDAEKLEALEKKAVETYTKERSVFN